MERKKTKIFISIVLLFLLILFAVTPFLLQKLAGNKSFFEQRFSNTLSLPVSISDIKASWRGLSPTLNFTNIILFNDAHETQLFTAKKLKVSLNIFYSLLHWQPIPNSIELDNAHISATQQADGKWQINGIKTQLGNTDKKFDIQNLVSSIHGFKNINFTNVDMDIQTQNGTKLFVRNLNLHLENGPFNRTLSAHGNFGQTKPAPFNITLKMPKFYKHAHISGNLSIKDFSPTPWLSGLSTPEINVNLVLQNNSLNADINKASINAIAIHDATINIQDINHPILQIHASINDSYQNISKLIYESSLNDLLGDKLKDFKYEGFLKGIVDLSLPLDSDNNEKIKIDGTIAFLPAGILHLFENKIQLTDVKGKIIFTEDNIHSEDLQAKFLNEPLAIKISSTNNQNTSSTNIDFLGTLSANGLIHTYRLNSISKIIQGKTAFTSKIIITQENNKSTTLFNMDSNLLGLGLNVTPPFKKATQEIIHLHSEARLTDKNLTIQSNYGNRFSAALTMQTNAKQQWMLHSGNIQFSNKPAKLSSKPGLIIQGKIDTLDIPFIDSLFEKRNVKNDKNTAPPNIPNIKINTIDLKFSQVKLPNYKLANLIIKAKTVGHVIQTRLLNSNINATVKIPYNLSDGVIRGDFKYLHIPPMEDPIERLNSPPPSPESVPCLYLVIHDLTYTDHDLGAIALSTSHEKDTLNIDTLLINSATFNLKATGAWSNKNNKPKTYITGHLDTENLGEMLQSWSISESIAKGKGTADFAVHWPSAIYAPEAKQVNATLSFHFEDGSIIDAMQNNQLEARISQLLNLVSFKGISTVLSKPFSLIEPSKHFDFDTLEGDVIFSQGKAVTNNFLLDGPIAKVEAKGSIFLIEKTYDLILEITPYIAHGLTTTAVVLTGGIAAGGVWVINKLIGGFLNAFFELKYHVTGPWSEPVMKKVAS